MPPAGASRPREVSLSCAQAATGFVDWLETKWRLNGEKVGSLASSLAVAALNPFDLLLAEPCRL